MRSNPTNTEIKLKKRVLEAKIASVLQKPGIYCSRIVYRKSYYQSGTSPDPGLIAWYSYSRRENCSLVGWLWLGVPVSTSFRSHLLKFVGP